jgi:hypothetical protein
MPNQETVVPPSKIPLTSTQPPKARQNDISLMLVIFSPNIILERKITKMGAVESKIAAIDSDVMLIAAL